MAHLIQIPGLNLPSNDFYFLTPQIPVEFQTTTYSCLLCVLVSFPVTVIKYPEKISIWEKGLIWLKIPGYSSSLQEPETNGHITLTAKSAKVWVTAACLARQFYAITTVMRKPSHVL